METISEYLKNRSTQQPDGCVTWDKPLNRGGYGVAYYNMRIEAHRLAYINYFGDILDGYFVCHKCDNRRCINPDHLFIGTSGDNVRDMLRKGRSPRKLRAIGDHCKHGHLLTAENYKRGAKHGSFYCKDCVKEQGARNHAKYRSMKKKT